MPAQRPSLLFLMTDHQRADSLGMVQAGIEVTPSLNCLAGQGTAFTRAYNTCPLCVPARTALATGLYPTRNGVVFNDWRGRRAGDHLTLHEALARAGYAVAHVGVDHIRVRPGLRDRIAFAAWCGEEEYRRYAAERGLEMERRPFQREIAERQDERRVRVRYSNTRTAVWPFPAEQFKDCFWARAAADFLRNAPEPFALFVYLWAPHPPLWVPEPYASMFPPDELALPANVGEPAAGEPPGRRQGIAAQLAEGLSLEEWRRVWAAHLGLVRLADDALGRVLDALEAAGRARDTIALFAVDHGDQLGQHRMYQKMEMYEEAVRVPLLVRGPGVREQRVQAPVSHLDVMPTVLDLLGLPVPDGLDGALLGRVLRDGEEAPDRPVFAQYSGNPTLGDTRRAVITRRWKYVYDPDDRPELFDLLNDPLEMTNRAGDPAHAATRLRLHALCERWHREHGDWVEFPNPTK